MNDGAKPRFSTSIIPLPGGEIAYHRAEDVDFANPDPGLVTSPLELAGVQVVDETIVPVFGNHQNAGPAGRADGRRCAPPIVALHLRADIHRQHYRSEEQGRRSGADNPQRFGVAQAERDAAGHQDRYEAADQVAWINEVEPGCRKRERSCEGRNPYGGRRRGSPLFLRQAAPEHQYPCGDHQDQAGESRRSLNVVDGGATGHPARLLAGHEAHCGVPGPGSKRQVSEQVPPAASLLGHRQRQQRQTNRGGGGDGQDRATAVRDRGDQPQALRGDREGREVMRAEGQGGRPYPQAPGCEVRDPEARGRRSTAPMRKRGRTGRRSALPANTTPGMG